ncbi:MarR family winged helix-turn-helix transcriptional regulator [Neobacillus ginsengisoli]|uniref:DNA-binding MarR family transcriptional regulator n=1 Tax=Neobacillus ginsengisoli TaxID=904295 RepID=A0ABT9XYX3_9BACI|nr:MarR family transcriptional regulator [Neobacillus ginsengisoli]MDQ0200779.1 DNA-binding MarR family transcriptional regulator [Neobacillus ginsengisoli]
MNVLNNEIFKSCLEINKAIKRLVKIDADRLGITVVQLHALYKLSTNPNSSLGELADKLRLTNSTVSGVIERLVHNGLVERVVLPENRRTVSIHLTEKGKQKLDQFFSSDSILIIRLNEVLELPEEEISNLLRLQKFVLTTLSLEEE